VARRRHVGAGGLKIFSFSLSATRLRVFCIDVILPSNTLALRSS
jgi:hypothetical protein